MERFLCIHGHFYQPPRENPWLEAIEIQDSAYPYHDWNERITAECYAPNTASRTLDSEGRINGIISNYASISFNFGPTLLSWMERSAPETYRAILAADRQSRSWRSGHGAALAQVYNHIIMPLASRRDKETQVRWGIRDFEARFQRFPEGMWLAETAVDTETLEILAAAGIRFTILAPHQAAAMRRIGSSRWQDVSGARIDPSQAYLCTLPSGRQITLFFYDGPISQAVAFEKLLSSGEQFATRLLSGFASHRKHSQLVHIATDGETYGHHHRFGEMALGHALHYIKANNLARLTNYGEYLELHPPTCEVQIVEGSSWSCMHGVERWRSDCGCSTGGEGGWNQQWRQPLRESLDWLADELAIAYEGGAAGLLKDPWTARDDYIDLMLQRRPENVNAFLHRHALHPLKEEERVTVLALLEMQRHALLMFTSCGWFFDELSGLETVQIIQYAGRAIQLAGKYAARELEAPFLARLALARSNLPSRGDGAAIYAQSVKPAMIDLIKVGAHYAVSAIFEEYAEETAIFSYQVMREDFLLLTTGEMRLAIGRVFIRSSVTRQSDRISFCTLYFGGHALNSGVRSFRGEAPYQKMKKEIVVAFKDGDVATIIRRMDSHFGRNSYSLRHLFRDEQRKILQYILAGTLQEFEEKFSALYNKSCSLAGFLRETGMPVPHRFMATAEMALNLQIQKIFAGKEIDMSRLLETLEEIGVWKVGVDKVPLEFIVRRRLEGAMAALREKPESPQRLTEVYLLLEAVQALAIEVNLWEVQNIYWELLRSRQIEIRPCADDSVILGASESLWGLGCLLHFNVAASLAARSEL